MYLQAQILRVQTAAMTRKYEALVRSKDYRRRRAYEASCVCCDAYHLKSLPENIRCCVLGQRYGF